MGNIKYFSAHLRPSNFVKRLRQHDGNVSSGSKAKVLAKRTVLGKRITFYENGMHVIHGELDITEEEMFNSNILRFIHASLLINEPVGDKAKIWVNAAVNPVQVWLYGMPIEQFIRKALFAIRTGKVSADCLLDQHTDYFVEKTSHE